MSIKAGVQFKEKNSDFFLVTSLITLGKRFVHRCTYLKVKPHINEWKNELKLLTDYMTNKNAFL